MLPDALLQLLAQRVELKPKRRAQQGAVRGTLHYVDPWPGTTWGQNPCSGSGFVQALWSKNEQPQPAHAGCGAATVINWLSTDCSTVFVRKLQARA